MHIAFWHFHTFRLHRGIETLVVSMANALSRQGVTVSIIGAKPTITPLVVADPEVKVHTFATGRYYASTRIVPAYVKHFLTHQYDHVFAFFADFGEMPTVSILSKIHPIPLSLYLCYPLSTVPHRYASFSKYGWGHKAQHIIADADWIANEASSYFNRLVQVVPVGTDTDRFCPNVERRESVRRKLGYGPNDVVLLNVSALERNKGTRRVIEAMGRLSKRFPHLKYYILGSGNEETDLKNRTAELGIQDAVVFGGTTHELEDYYNMADIFILLADSEANSVACVEAMSTQLPVIVSNSDGFIESVKPEAGIHVEPDNHESVDNAIESLLTDQIKRSKMGQAGRDDVLANYTWDQMAKMLLSVLGSN